VDLGSVVRTGNHEITGQILRSEIEFEPGDILIRV
jgi:hypothetical protein